MEGRNPYAAPTAPLIAADEPTQISNDPDSFEYGGFWRRVGALLLDSLILSPLGIIMFLSMNYTPRAYLYFALPNVVITLLYYVFLVKRFGGTPGKLITRMRITMTDGRPVTTQAAVLRYLPLLIIHVLSLLAMIQGASGLGDDFPSMSFLDKMRVLAESAPRWNTIVTWLGYLWWIATAITLAANARKRAAHDFIAGTVVLRTD